ncbi:hypothetical protein [Actinomadura oligospora]|uniref:hypothetical protein n=1 Tax=Actinomadura oligospora TaxID=111804 RepID=UPI0004B49C64|nr:hypothetical protein [Actinomadura oligospora]
MRRKLILTAGVLATAGTVTLGTAGAASAKESFTLTAGHKTVHPRGAVAFQMAAASDSAGEHLSGLRFCLQRSAGKAKFTTVKCTTQSHWSRKDKAQVYTLGYRFGTKKGAYTFRGVVQSRDRHHHWNHTYKTSSVVVHVK